VELVAVAMVVCGLPDSTLMLKNLLVSRWLLFMADDVPGGRSKGGKGERTDPWMSSADYILADSVDA
jgi:hypothetical protein